MKNKKALKNAKQKTTNQPKITKQNKATKNKQNKPFIIVDIDFYVSLILEDKLHFLRQEKQIGFYFGI